MKGFSEFEIEEFIWNNIQNPGELMKRGLDMPKAVYYRQMQFPTCGRPDIVGVSLWSRLASGQRSVVPTVRIYELKKGEVTGQDVLQIFRYVAYAYKIAPEIAGNAYPDLPITNVSIGGYIIGNSFSREALCALYNSYTTIGIQFDFDLTTGIKFCDVYEPEKRTDFRYDDKCGLANLDMEGVSMTSDIVGRFKRINSRYLKIENPN